MKYIVFFSIVYWVCKQIYYTPDMLGSIGLPDDDLTYYKDQLIYSWDNPVTLHIYGETLELHYRSASYDSVTIFFG